jgi:hypothetical protein
MNMKASPTTNEVSAYSYSSTVHEHESGASNLAAILACE